MITSILMAMLTPATSDTMLPRPAAARVESPSLAPKTASIWLPATSYRQQFSTRSEVAVALWLVLWS